MMQDGLATLTGNRYLFSGQVLPDLRKWLEEKVGLDVKKNAPPQDKIQSTTHPTSPPLPTSAVLTCSSVG